MGYWKESVYLRQCTHRVLGSSCGSARRLKAEGPVLVETRAGPQREEQISASSTAGPCGPS
ncbi:hypothetical protein HMPREF9004_0478 [Schaalia cardiffensis F0333]|uniref:Uncharacterized protein n=1 Tax=Schaalia cardiffensis F0333 TaxID=888050 RepID=N6XC76_9ACTO|nr:hypothetical protein HMPREF9004_0478 [Schaalia cardiffensis F0333]